MNKLCVLIVSCLVAISGIASVASGAVGPAAIPQGKFTQIG